LWRIVVSAELQVTPPRQAAIEALRGVAGKYDAAIVLAYLPEDELRQLADALPEADAVIGGPTGQPISPKQIGPTLLTSATNKGKFMAQLDAPAFGSADRWKGRIVELNERYADDPDQKRGVDRFHVELGRIDFAPSQTSFVGPLPSNLPKGFAVAGTAACKKCHEDDCRLWRESKHATAWRALKATVSHVDPECQRCHTTGYGLPGGFASIRDDDRPKDRVNVGCESCHGPCQAHVVDSAVPSAACCPIRTSHGRRCFGLSWTAASRRGWRRSKCAPLEKMLKAGNAKERVVAALALVPLGKVAAAAPVALDTVRANRDLMETAAKILPWLVWKDRVKMFRDLSSLASDGESRARLIAVLAEAPDHRAAELLWKLLADAKVTDDEARSIYGSLMVTYLGDSLRTDAFQIRLVTRSAPEARKISLETMKGTDSARKRLALIYLIHGASELWNLHDGIYLYNLMNVTVYSSSQSGTPIVPKPPEGVTMEDVRPLVHDSNAEVAACAGYLMALLGDADRMEPLLQYWRRHGESSSEWRKLVYRAIAVDDDPKYIPVLREIYSKLEQYEVSEFYWTIRIMSGSEILAFRKQIRDEVGASQLGQ
jgi:Cytochrome c554 and c-prime